MSKYYSNNDSNLMFSVIYFLSAIALLLLLVCGTNSCSASTWNDGVCPDCETRYELRGVSQGSKYYACPECGQEVKRY